MTPPLKIGVLGHGTIGRRVASAVAEAPDMILVGIVATRPTPRLASALAGGALLFTEADHQIFSAAGFSIAGGLDDLLGRIDVIVDCGPRGTAASRQAQYDAQGVATLLHGGEHADPTICDFTSVVRCEGSRRDVARIASCNTTALARIVAAAMGAGDIRSVTAVLVRAATDRDKAGKGAPNATISHLGSTHHAEDLQRLFPTVAFETVGCHVPTNLGHLAHVFIDWTETPTAETVVAHLAAGTGLQVVDGGDGGLDELGRSKSSVDGDAYDVLIWRSGIETVGKRTRLSAAVHMEAVVIPDTLAGIRFLGEYAAQPAVEIRSVEAVTC